MAKLHLHIGHPKTGSSAIQVSCARSTSKLAENGIVYPEHRSTTLAMASQFTAGNLTLHKLVEDYSLAASALTENQEIFYSCEGLFDDLAKSNSLVASLKNKGVEISVLLFLRNPVEYALSLYQQKVKGEGHVGSLADFLDEFDQLAQTETVLDHIDALQIPLTMHRYDDQKEYIIDLTEQWLNLPVGTLFRLNNENVNRTATRSEQFFLRELSTHLGPSGSDHIGRALADKLPDVPHELPALTSTCYGNFVSKITPQVQRLNNRLPSNLHYHITPYKQLYPHGLPKEHLVFSPEQLEVITAALATRSPDAEFTTEFIRWIKKTTEGDALSASDIYRLNRLGHILRPGNFPEERMRRLKNRVHQKYLPATTKL